MKNRRFSFVRHGKVNGPAALYGKTDVALSAQGDEELLAGLENLHRKDAIVNMISSPLQRCLGAAEAFAKHQQVPMSIMHGWQECDFGDWDGVDFNLLQNQWPQLEKFWQSPLNTTPPNGENLQAFANRVHQAWQTMLLQQTCEHTVIVCHGGSIRMLIAALLNIPLASALFQQLHIDYCSHTRIDIGDHPEAKPIIRWIGAVL